MIEFLYVVKHWRANIWCAAVLWTILDGGIDAHACHADSPEGFASPWRRTADGWERSDLWQVSPAADAGEKLLAPSPRPWLHPALVAGLQAAVALALLRCEITARAGGRHVCR